MINSNKNNFSSRLDIHRAFCITLAFMIGLIFYSISKNSYGYWIPMTTLVIFSGSRHELVVQRSLDRILGTFFGAIIVYLFTVLFISSDYRFAYLIIPVYFFFFYMQGITSNYFFIVIILTIGLGFYSSLASIDTSSSVITLYSRIIATAIGSALAIFGEYLIKVSCSSIVQERKYYIRQYFFTIGEIITTINFSFIGHRLLNKKLLKEIRSYMRSINSIEGTYINIRQELDFTDEHEDVLNIFFYKTNEILSSILRIITIVSSDKLDNSIISQEEILEVGYFVTSKYQSVIKRLHGKKDTVTERLSGIRSRILKEPFSNSTVLYVKELINLNDLLDEFFESIEKYKKEDLPQSLEN